MCAAVCVITRICHFIQIIYTAGHRMDFQMIYLEWSHITSTNQSQSDAKFVTEKGGKRGTEQLQFNALIVYKLYFIILFSVLID